MEQSRGAQRAGQLSVGMSAVGKPPEPLEHDYVVVKYSHLVNDCHSIGCKETNIGNKSYKFYYKRELIGYNLWI
jgi:hypothetical protein